jgi:hypothetical protein
MKVMYPLFCSFRFFTSNGLHAYGHELIYTKIPFILNPSYILERIIILTPMDPF